MRELLIAAAVLLILGGHDAAQAYENQRTHPKLAQRSADLIRETYPDIEAHSVKLTTGAYFEDVSSKLAVLDHFYDAKTGQQLSVPGILGMLGKVGHTDALTKSHLLFQEAVGDYFAGRKDDSYFALGRALHLLEDMHQPAHTQNDPHVPKGYSTILGLDGTDGSHLEAHVEAACEGDCPVVPPGTAPTPISFVQGQYPGSSGLLSDLDFLAAAAKDTYLRTAFPGELPTQEGGMGSIDILGAQTPVLLQPGDLSDLRPCYRNKHFELKGVNQTLCYDPKQKYDGGIRFDATLGEWYGMQNDWWQIPDQDGDINNPPLTVGPHFYVEQYDEVGTGTGLTLEDVITRPLLTQAVELGAAYLEYFAAAVDKEPPRFKALQKGDNSGPTFSDGDVLDANSIYVEAEDPAEDGYAASGVYELDLNGPANQKVPFSGSATAQYTFSGLQDGVYKLTVRDGLGNVSQPITFTVDVTQGPQPSPAPANPQPGQPPYPPAGSSARTGASGLLCAGDRDGVVKAEITDDGSVYQTDPYTEPVSPLCFPWACTKPKVYDISVRFQDAKGNWGPSQAIHCNGQSPQAIGCNSTGCQAVDFNVPPDQIDVQSSVGELIALGGGPDVCSYTIQAPDHCHVTGFGGGEVGVAWEKDFGAVVGAGVTSSYNPPKRCSQPDCTFLKDQPYGMTLSANGIRLAQEVVPTHVSHSLSVILPSLGQPDKQCDTQGHCLIAPVPPGGKSGPAPAPPPICGPPGPAQTLAAAAQGLNLICDTCRMPIPSVLPNQYTLSMNCKPAPPGTTMQTCYWSQAQGRFFCPPGLQPTAQNCTSSSCNLSGPVTHLSEWTFATTLPTSLPDGLPPTLSGLAVSPDGANWYSTNAPVFQGQTVSVHATAKDPSFSVQVVSGLAISTEPVSFSTSPDELVLFHFDDGSGSSLHEASSLPSTGVVAGSAQTCVPGRFGTALQFNGSDQYLYVASSPSDRLDVPVWTLGVWVNPAQAGRTGSVVYKTGDPHGGFSLILQGGRPQLHINNSALQPITLTSPDALPAGQWSYLAATCDGDHVRLFVNGEQRASSPGYMDPDSSTFLIGWGPGGIGNFYGAIDELKFLSRAQSPEEIMLDYHRGFAVAYSADAGTSWRFAPSMDYGGALEGRPGPATITGSGITLARSTSTNQVEVVASDLAGHISTAAMSVAIAPPDQTPLAFASVETSTDSVHWWPLGSVLPAGPASLRVSVADPAVPPALQTGIETSTRPAAPGMLPGTIHFWHFDEGAGGIAYDSAGDKVIGVNPSNWTSGQFGGALNFPGGSLNTDRFDMPVFTGSFWLFPTGTTNGLILKKFDDNRQGFEFGASNGAPFMELGTWVDHIYLSASTPLSTGTWHYIAGSFDGVGAKLYVDGALVASNPSVAYRPDGSYLAIGMSTIGKLDELRFLNRGITASEVLSEYRAGYGATFSPDGGNTAQLTAASYQPGAAAGDPQGELTVSGFTLAASTVSNVVQVFATDRSGNVSTAAYVIPAGPDTTPPGIPTIISTRAVVGGIRINWAAAPGEPSAAFAVSRDGVVIATTAASSYDDLTNASLGDSFNYAVAAIDLSGNVSATSAASHAVADRIAPTTTLTVVGSSVTINGVIFAAAGSTIAVSASDGGAQPSGVALTSVTLDGTSFTPPLSPAEGAHVIRFGSIDAAGNAEDLKVSSVTIDATPPATTVTVSGTWLWDTFGRLQIDTNARISFSANDPSTHGPASGVAQIEYSVDGGTPMIYGNALSLPSGQHMLSYSAVDAVGNTEVKQSTLVVVMSPAPAGFAGVASAPDRIDFSWLPSTDAVGYVVQLSTQPDFSTLFLATATPNAFLNLGGLQPGTTFFARLNAFSASNDSFYGPPIAVTTPQLYVSGSTQITNGAPTVQLTAPVPINSIVGVSSTSPAGSIAIAASSAQGLQLVSNIFSVDPSTAFSPQAQLVFRFDPAVIPDTSTLAVYRFDGVSWSSAGVITSQFLTLGADSFVTAYLAHSSLYALFIKPPDMLAPRTTLTIGLPRYVSGAVFVSSFTQLSISAVDDKQVVGDGQGVGVARTLLAVDTAPFATYAGPFSLAAEGAHTLRYYSVDGAGNAEAISVSSVTVDITAPTASAAAGAPSFIAGDGRLFVSSDTLVSLSAVDGGGAASGVDHIEAAVDGGGFSTYVSSLTFAEGPHSLLYRAVDHLGLMGTPQSLTLQSDATPPATSLLPSGTFYLSAGRDFAPAAFTYALSAVDTVSSGTPAGVAVTRYAVDGGSFAVAASTFSLAEGLRQISFFSVDRVDNVEALKSAAIAVDGTPPVTALTLQGGHQFAGPDAASFFASADTRFTFPAVDPVVNGVASGLETTRWEDNGGAWQAYTSSVTLNEGVHHLAYQSQDNVGNAEVARSTTALIDAAPPLTQLAIVSGRQFAGPNSSTFYASSDTRLALPALDPLVNGVASGVAFTRWQDNGGTFQASTTAISLAEGAHAFSYQSQDNVANLEVLRSTSVWVDATPPVTAFAFGKPYYQASDGTNYVTPATPVSFSAVDPALPTGQPGSGVNHIEVAVDGAPFATYATALTFAEGRHTVLYRSIDNVGNVEATRSLALQSDATPPVTALALQSGHQFPGPDAASFFASADTRLAFDAADPVVNGVASGVAFTRWGDNGGAEQLYTTPVALAEGVHHLAYQSQDNVQNLEVVRSTTVLIDATPPLTQLAIVGGRQFPGPDGSTFYASSDTRLALPAADPVSNGVASGLAWTRWQDNSGAFQAFVSSFGLTEGAHKLAYQSQDNVANLEVLRSTNVWVDATPPASVFAFGLPYYQAPDGTNYVTPATPLTLSAADPNLPSSQPGSGVNHLEFSLDGASFATYAAPLTFAEGRHALLYRAVDNVGNVEAAHALALQSDATPPVSTLVIGQPQYQLPSVLLVSSRTPFSITAVDPVVNGVASDVKDTYYRVSDVAPSTAAFAAFATPFTVSGLDVNKVIEFHSRDNVLNAEVVRSSTVLLDATPPEIALLSPAGCDAGICHVLKGKFPVLGTARDLHFASYVLEAAAGQDATSGFVQISSGAVAVSSGTLGVWDAGKLSGWQTLRLTATDLVQNISVLTINVWVGDPAALMVLGNHDTFNMPTGVAVSSSGAIYVADREADRVQVFSSTGALLASFGGHPRDDDDHSVSSSTLRLHEPAGVAVDAGGNIFVADTDDNRVLELSPSGRVLLELGRAKAKRDDDHGSAECEEGSGPGEFHEPFGVAVDGAGSIYVADTGNHRVQVFSSSGAFTLQFALPAVPKPRGDDTRDEDDDGAALGRPVAVALDAAGRIYLADPAGHRALVYGSTGTLLSALPLVGDRPDEPGTPDGVAVSPSGNCLLVSDKKLDRVLKFDVQGANNLVFGQKGEAGDKKTAGTIVFRKPAGLALDAAGNLYVADRNNESIKKFGLPNGQPTLVVPPPAPGDDLAAKDVVDHDAGGTVAREDKAAVAVPPQALPQDLKITVAPPAPGPDDNSRRRAQQDNQLKVASPPVDFGPEGTKFAVPATLTIPYDPQLVAAQGVSEDDLKINYWNPAKQQWQAFDSTVDKANHTVTAKTSHFSLYQVLSSTPGQVGVAGGPVADPTFTVHAVYAFPNPAVRGAKPTIHAAVGVADEVKITILNVAGQEVAHGELYGTPPVVDDGSGPQYAYEWVWDGHIASGMYFYVVEASKAGYPKIRRAGKLGVVR